MSDAEYAASKGLFFTRFFKSLSENDIPHDDRKNNFEERDESRKLLIHLSNQTSFTLGRNNDLDGGLERKNTLDFLSW